MCRPSKDQRCKQAPITIFLRHKPPKRKEGWKDRIDSWWNRSWYFTSLLQRGSCPVEPRIAVSHYLEHLFMNPENKRMNERDLREEKELGRLKATSLFWVMNDCVPLDSSPFLVYFSPEIFCECVCECVCVVSHFLSIANPKARINEFKWFEYLHHWARFWMNALRHLMKFHFGLTV